MLFPPAAPQTLRHVARALSEANTDNRFYYAGLTPSVSGVARALSEPNTDNMFYYAGLTPSVSGGLVRQKD